MFIKNLFFFDRSTSGKSNRRNNEITSLFNGGLVFILLLTLISLAFMQSGQLFEDGSFPFTESSLVPWTVMLFSLMSASVFSISLVLKCLQSHIGEKRFADGIIELNSSPFIAQFSVTALYKAVFFVFSAPFGMMRTDRQKSFAYC